MKKLTAMAFALLLIIGLLGGCGGKKEPPANTGGENPPAEEPKETLKIGLSMFTQEFPFYVTMQESFEAACREKGYEVVSTNASMDVSKQIDGCMDMLSRGIDALVITSWYGDALLDIFETAEKQGVPVFLISTNTAPDDAAFVTKVGTIDKDTTYLGGLLLCGAGHCRDRCRGVHDGRPGP